MKKLLALFTVIITAALLMGGCDDNNNNTVASRQPIAPQGVYTVTGDNMVRVYWNGVYDNNAQEYVVWRSLSQQTGYTEIARVNAEDNPNLDLVIYHYDDVDADNGTTYWYAVSTVNSDGRTSDLSAEDAYDTPRPDGSVTLWPVQIDSTLAGYNFESSARVRYNSPLADVYIDIFDAIPYLNAGNDNTDVQDMGFTSDFDEISMAPDSGWSVLGYSELIEGHTYVVWTSDNHFAKMRVRQLNGSGAIVFDWGYQTAVGNPELIAPLQRPVHGPNYLKKQSTTISQQ